MSRYQAHLFESGVLEQGNIKKNAGQGVPRTRIENHWLRTWFGNQGIQLKATCGWVSQYVNTFILYILDQF